MIRYFFSNCIVLIVINLVLVNYVFCQTNPQPQSMETSRQSAISDGPERSLKELEEAQAEIKKAKENIEKNFEKLKALNEKKEIDDCYDGLFKDMEKLVEKLSERSLFMTSINQLISGYKINEERDRANAQLLVGLARKRMEDKAERNRAKAMIEKYRQRLVRKIRWELEQTTVDLSQQKLDTLKKLEEYYSEEISESVSNVEESVKEIATFRSKYEIRKE